MKKSQLWFMVEGVGCGLLHIVAAEFAASVYYDSIPWLCVLVPALGVTASAVGFFFLMRRYPGIKLPKFALGSFAYAVMLPAWTVYRAAFQLSLFPQRELNESDWQAVLRLVGWYAAGVIVTHAIILIGFIIRKQRRKKKKGQ